MAVRDTGRGVGLAALALIIGALLCVNATATAGDRNPTAVSAKKKCKKGKKSAAAAKKKCRRKRSPAAPSQPGSPPPPAPRIQRAHLTWPSNAGIDLHVWDSALRESTWFSQGIPSSLLQGDGSVNDEFFFDQLSPSTREFAFGACMVNEPAFPPASFTLTAVRADGVTEVFNDSLASAGDSFLFVPPGAADPDPLNTGAWCPP